MKIDNEFKNIELIAMTKFSGFSDGEVHERYGKKVSDWSGIEWTRFYWEELAPTLIDECEYCSDMIDVTERFFKGPYFNDVEVMQLASYGNADFAVSVYFCEYIDISLLGEYPPVFVKLINDLRLVRRVMALHELGLPISFEIESMSETDAIEWAKWRNYWLSENNINAAERAAIARDFNFLLAKFPSSLRSASFDLLLILVKNSTLDNLTSMVMSIDAEAIFPDEDFFVRTH